MGRELVKPFRSFTVLENIVLAAGSRKTDAPFRALMRVQRRVEIAKAEEILELLRIRQAAHACPSELPLGYLKRLEMGRALALEPKILLLDEPLAGLNHAEAAKLADTILALNKSGLTIVLIEHNLGEVLRICSRLVVLDNGKPLRTGEPEKVMADSVVRAAYLGEGGGDAQAH